jgi:hypothetical protein
LLFGSLIFASILPALAQSGSLSLPKTVEAGSAFTIQSSGNGAATLYIVGLGQVLKRNVQLGQATIFPSGSLYNAGLYLAFLSAGSSSDSGQFEVVPLSRPSDLSFLAKPSRLPVGLHDGITGAIYVFDAYRNLIVAATTASFQLSNPIGALQKRTVTTSNGAAWVGMDSTPQEGIDRFVAQVGDVSSTRVIRQVPGDPCGLKMSAKESGQQVHLETELVRDCSGNAVPDGTIVTFTEAYNGARSTVDVPVKRGIAQTEMPAHHGATISVASGVAMGNQIRWEK